MNSTIDKLQNLNKSVQKLETVLQEFWSNVEELEEDLDFKKLVKDAKFSENLAEFNTCVDSIPEDGTTVADLEDAIADLIDTIKTL
jgi:exonuclease VII small subunit